MGPVRRGRRKQSGPLVPFGVIMTCLELVQLRRLLDLEEHLRAVGGADLDVKGVLLL